MGVSGNETPNRPGPPVEMHNNPADFDFKFVHVASCVFRCLVV